MNVLVIAQLFPPSLGGAATRAYNIAKGLALNGCNVTAVVAFPHYPHGNIPAEYRWKPLKVEWMGNVKLIRTFMPPIKSEGFFKRVMLMSAFAVSSLFALPFVGKVDAVFATSWAPGLVYGKLKKAPVALNVDDLTIEDVSALKLTEADSVFSKIGTMVYRLFYVKGDVVVPISPGYVETISKKYCVEKSKIHVVDIGVDLTVFRNDIAEVPKGKSFKVFYAGVLGYGYDFEQIFRAAKILEEKKADVQFVIHGIGECLESIRRRIKELNLSNVRLSGKLLGSRKEVAGLLSEADALILPLKDYGRPYLGIPSKLYEYQALGKPIICCAEGEPAKYVKNSNSGVIVKPGDFDELAQAILSLNHDRSKAKHLGGCGRLFVEKNSSIEKIGSRMLSLFKLLNIR
jgi:glycosyltransferase involved in cell wall biosynthesis